MSFSSEMDIWIIGVVFEGKILFKKTFALPPITSSGLQFKLFNTDISFQKIPLLKPVPKAFTNASLAAQRLESVLKQGDPLFHINLISDVV